MNYPAVLAEIRASDADEASRAAARLAARNQHFTNELAAAERTCWADTNAAASSVRACRKPVCPDDMLVLLGAIRSLIGPRTEFVRDDIESAMHGLIEAARMDAEWFSEVAA